VFLNAITTTDLNYTAEISFVHYLSESAVALSI